jgi:hypothetical protein
MDEQFIIGQLEGLVERFGIQIRYEPMHQDEESVKIVGGMCRLKEEYVVIINSKATFAEKIRALAETLKHFDLDGVYILPAVRELLEKIP